MVGYFCTSIDSMEAIAVIIDTSGSLPAETLADFWAEVRGIASETEPERFVLLQVDTAVRHAQEFTAGDLPGEITVRGRGGTDFRPGFPWLDERDIRPGVYLYFTDPECSRYPETKPPFSFIWINYGDPPGDRHREIWGERADIGAP
ncbi:MAG: VWA-like domain-containing protein [Rhodobacter sp.]|nr:VWA-like domain-containing protein [Rhodobacter sp.]